MAILPKIPCTYYLARLKNVRIGIFLVVMAWRHELNLPSSHYRKVPILAKIRNDMEEIKRDRYLKQLIDSQQNGFIKVE